MHIHMFLCCSVLFIRSVYTVDLFFLSTSFTVGHVHHYTRSFLLLTQNSRLSPWDTPSSDLAASAVTESSLTKKRPHLLAIYPWGNPQRMSVQWHSERKRAQEGHVIKNKWKVHWDTPPVEWKSLPGKHTEPWLFEQIKLIKHEVGENEITGGAAAERQKLSFAKPPEFFAFAWRNLWLAMPRAKNGHVVQSKSFSKSI